MQDSEERLPPLASLASDEERFMREALKEAWRAFDRGEVPIGAVIVRDGRIIARSHNEVERLQDATAHAEILSIGQAAASENWRLSGATLYCTVEPCPMCAGAAISSRVSALVWGAPDIRQGANGSWVDLFAIPHPIHQVAIRGGILQGWCQAPLRLFFQKRRKENDERAQ